MGVVMNEKNWVLVKGHVVDEIFFGIVRRTCNK